MSDVKITVGSDSSQARRDIGRLSKSVGNVTQAANTASKASGKIGEAGATSLKAMSRASTETAAGLQNLMKLAVSFVGAIALGTTLTGYYRIADSLTLINNKLKLVTRSQEELVFAQRKLLDLQSQSSEGEV